METLEGYDIIEKIGEGGMGQVFRAVHRRLDRPVAIKRLAPHLSHNQDMLRRFLQEARLQARLSHPNVVNIFDLIENEQGIFLVMEYVEGQTARDMLIARGRIEPPEALMIAEGVLSGLAFMHENGVVHRDIKPSNIMASISGAIKVTDFGIARLVNEETGLTRFGAGIGTLHYMAPELIKSGEVSFSIDIYSLGATLHEMLSGAPPFTGNTDLEIMMGHLEKEPPELILPGDDEVCALCRDAVFRALAKTPDQRFPSAEAFLAEVRRIRQLMAKSPSYQAAASAPIVASAARRTPNPDQERPTTYTPVPASAPTSAVPIAPPEAERSAPADSAVSAASGASAQAAAPVAPAAPDAADAGEGLAAAPSATQAAEAPSAMKAPPTSISTPPAPEPTESPAPTEQTAPDASAETAAPTAPKAPTAAASAPSAQKAHAKGGRALYLGAAALILAGVVLFFLLPSGEKTSTPPPASTTEQAPAAPAQTAPAQTAPAASEQTVPAAPEQTVPAAPAQTVPAASSEAAPAESPAPTPVPDKTEAAVEPPRTEQPEPATAQEAAPPQAPEEQAAKETAASSPSAGTPESATQAPAQASPQASSEESGQPAAPERAASPAPAEQAPAPGQEAASSQTPAETAQTQQRIIYVNTQDARLRAEADAEGDILTTLDIGTKLVALGADGDWLRAQTPDGKTGYIMARLTSDAPPAPPAPTQAPARTAKPSARKPKQPTGADQGWKIVK